MCQPQEIGSLLGELALWRTADNEYSQMDGAVFPEWLKCAKM
jgi:hypothetical protein